MDVLNMEKNQEVTNLLDLNNEQLEQLAHRDKTDSTDRSSNAFSDISADVDVDVDDDDPFTTAETEPMEIPKNFKPRVRRVSDVIDSVGDLMHELADIPKLGSTPDKVPPSPLSSGYGSFGNGNVQASTQWYVNLPSPVMKTRRDVTDGAKNSAIDATPMDKDPDTPTGEQAEGFMPVDKDADEYNMNHKRRGKAIIFNHDKFENTNLGPRDGSHHDVKSLDVTLSGLGFQVIIHHNLDYAQMKSVIVELAQEDHSDADCLVITVLTHGLGGNYLLSKDVPYNAELLWAPFTADKCTTLAGKPKIFIIQACRGDKLDPGMTLKERRGSRTETDSDKSYKIPTHADFLMAFSSVAGYYSWRNADEGTWFIQSLCQELQNTAATTDLLKILTRAARRVALDCESFNAVYPWQHEQKQVPSFSSMLIRDLFFRPKV